MGLDRPRPVMSVAEIRTSRRVVEVKRGGYDVAQICLNGHVVTSSIVETPKRSQQFCGSCGAETIMSCSGCSVDIRGCYGGGSYFERPAYCHACGKAFPWTEKGLETARELVAESELSLADKREFEASLSDVVSETPQTPVAAQRMKKILTRMGSETAGLVRQVLKDVVTAAVKGTLGMG